MVLGSGPAASKHPEIHERHMNWGLLNDSVSVTLPSWEHDMRLLLVVAMTITMAHMSYHQY